MESSGTTARPRDRMRRSIERGTHEVVHRGIHHDEGSSPVLFLIQYAHQNHACGANQRTPRFNQKMTSQRTDDARQLRRVGSLLRRLLRGVAYAKASAAIEVAERDALALEVAERPR